jgi:hypothetical protein
MYCSNREEYLFVVFDFFDGNDLIANILSEKHGLVIDKKIDGVYYSVISLRDVNNKYILTWHEDIENYIYSIYQDEEAIIQMRELVEAIVYELNLIRKECKLIPYLDKKEYWVLIDYVDIIIPRLNVR